MHSGCNFKIVDKKGTEIEKLAIKACYYSCRHYYDNKDYTCVTIEKKSEIPLTENEVKNYIDLLNEIPVFTQNIEMITDGDNYIFSIKFGNKGCSKTKLIGTFVALRYLWGDGNGFEEIPKAFLKLVDKYDEDLYLLLMIAHLALKKHFNSNHCLGLEEINLVEAKDVKFTDSMNETYGGYYYSDEGKKKKEDIKFIGIGKRNNLLEGENLSEILGRKGKLKIEEKIKKCKREKSIL